MNAPETRPDQPWGDYRRSFPLRCPGNRVEFCETPFGIWANGLVQIRFRHHGREHWVRLPLPTMDGYDIWYPRPERR